MQDIINNYPLSHLTTLQIGGPATKFTKVQTQKELVEVIKFAKDEKMDFLLIGSGSNLLVSDYGFDGLIIQNTISGIVQNKNLIKVKSGTTLQQLVDYTIQNNLSGLQKMIGIPGTIGGAVFGNAGAYGQSISDHLISVTVLNTDNLTLSLLERPQLRFGYRDSNFKRNNRNIILEATFELTTTKSSLLQKEAEDIIAKRNIKYPPGIKCPGSFFKNIIANTLPGEILSKIPSEKIIYGKLPAGTLLEAVGAKGDSLNQIKIAPYHANLFINQGHGTAADFYNLAKKYVNKVAEKFGIILEPEVQLINLPPF